MWWPAPLRPTKPLQESATKLPAAWPHACALKRKARCCSALPTAAATPPTRPSTRSCPRACSCRAAPPTCAWPSTSAAAGRAHRAARRRHQPVRPDRGRGAGHRPQQVHARHPRRQCRAAHRTRGARSGAGPPERCAQEAWPLVSGGRVHQRAGHAGRHGGQQLLRQPLDCLRQYGAQRARRQAWLPDGELLDFGRYDPPPAAPGRSATSCAAWPACTATRSRRAGPRCCAAWRATTWTSSTTRTRSRTPTDGSVNLAHLLIGSEGTLALTRSSVPAAQRAAARQGAGRGELPHVLSGDGQRRSTSSSWATTCRAGRSRRWSSWTAP
jgi:hypothetical protein